jgi:hypothetical protein
LERREIPQPRRNGAWLSKKPVRSQTLGELEFNSVELEPDFSRFNCCQTESNSHISKVEKKLKSEITPSKQI